MQYIRKIANGDDCSHYVNGVDVVDVVYYFLFDNLSLLSIFCVNKNNFNGIEAFVANFDLLF